MASTLERVKLDQISEIRQNVDLLVRFRDQMVERLIQGVKTFDEYTALAGEIRGIQRAIDTPYKPRRLTETE